MRNKNPFDKYLTEEDKLHISVVTYVTLQYPNALIHHSPNEGRRTPFERYKVSKLGLKKGFPDLIVIYSGKHLALELKSSKGEATEEQLDWLHNLKSQGWSIGCPRSFDKAKQIIDQCFKN